MKNENAKIFDSILNTIENEDIRYFAEQCIETIPDYFWEVGASSTGKYHPQYALGDLGLARHTCALVRFLNHILSVDCFGNKFTSREKDLMRVAGMMHDTRKSGDDEAYAKNKFTKFDHPLLAANEIRTLIGLFLKRSWNLLQPPLKVIWDNGTQIKEVKLCCRFQRINIRKCFIWQIILRVGKILRFYLMDLKHQKKKFLH